jgi:hypothetical protein
MGSIECLWIQYSCGASATRGHCPNILFVGFVFAADVRDFRPLGHECFISRRTNESRTSLKITCEFIGIGSCLLTRGVSHLLLAKNSEDSYCNVWV